jgi:ABC-type multidrug transport system fused ATPase/permease subunit
VRDAPILILDEPTTGLDADANAIVQAALRRLMKGRTTMIIAHDIQTVRHADQILVVEQGRIVERGTHDELMRMNARYAGLLGRVARDG